MIRLAVRVRREQAELVLAELLELVPAGVEELALGEETVEYAVYGSPGELPRLPDLNAAVGDALVEISTREIPDGWDERWKSFHRPVLVQAPGSPQQGHARLPSVRVRPPWEAPSARPAAELQEIVIDPGQAFGTGGHASTRLCLELLLELACDERRTGPLVDVGTGSGVLAIAAARLGFAPVLALDHERESVEAAGANAAANGVELEVRRFDLRAQALPWIDTTARAVGPVVVVANLLRPLLLELASTMACAPGHLLAGGLLKEEVDETVAAFAGRLGLAERQRRESDGWAAVWMSSS
ncbi:MAG: 50S ribosomal protein L11 methyltransferase [Solirubrobacteraceae bacterium]